MIMSFSVTLWRSTNTCAVEEFSLSSWLRCDVMAEICTTDQSTWKFIVSHSDTLVCLLTSFWSIWLIAKTTMTWCSLHRHGHGVFLNLLFKGMCLSKIYLYFFRFHLHFYLHLYQKMKMEQIAIKRSDYCRSWKEMYTLFYTILFFNICSNIVYVLFEQFCINMAAYKWTDYSKF